MLPATVHRVATFRRLSRRAPAILASASLLMAAGCDGLRLPALPARAAETTVTVSDSQTKSAAKVIKAAKRSVAVDPAVERGRFDQIRRGLRRLVVAEETYYAETGGYTEDLSRLAFRPEGGTEVKFLWLSRGGWAASGSHPETPGKDCVIYVGRDHAAPTTRRDKRSGREGVPVCDAPPPPVQNAPAAPAPVAAAEPPASATPDTSSALDAVAPTVQMRVDLRNLVRSQESYFGNQGVYARRMEPFALQYLWHRGVKITMLSANDVAWSARATHESRPGKTCVVWFGPVTERPATEVQKRVPEEPGTPACDD